MINDFRFAFRQLWKSPSFTITAVAVLALGIGVNTAIFSLVNVMLFQPPAYQEPAQVVQLFSQDKKDPKNFRAFSYPTYCDIRDQNTVFLRFARERRERRRPGEKGNFRRAVWIASLQLLSACLACCRPPGVPFCPRKKNPAPAAHVAVVSYSYWKKHCLLPRLLGSAPDQRQAYTSSESCRKGLREQRACVRGKRGCRSVSMTKS